MTNLNDAMKNVDKEIDPVFTAKELKEFKNEVKQETKFSATEQLVADRGKTHGAFVDHARCAQKLKEVIMMETYARAQRKQPRLTDQQRESIDMILHKIGRIVAGDSSFQDHWDDIAGYATIANKEF